MNAFALISLASEVNRTGVSLSHLERLACSVINGQHFGLCNVSTAPSISLALGNWHADIRSGQRLLSLAFEVQALASVSSDPPCLENLLSSIVSFLRKPFRALSLKSVTTSDSSVDSLTARLCERWLPHYYFAVSRRESIPMLSQLERYHALHPSNPCQD